jgi:hypothetical protein
MLRQAQHDKAQEAALIAGVLMLKEQYEGLKKLNRDAKAILCVWLLFKENANRLVK